jgi:hypothetical protein
VNYAPGSRGNLFLIHQDVARRNSFSRYKERERKSKRKRERDREKERERGSKRDK